MPVPREVLEPRAASSADASAVGVPPVLAKGAGAANEEGELLALHVQALSAAGDVELCGGNQTRLLVDGPATFAAMKQAISSAQRRILLESYIVEDQGVAAEIAQLLLQKAAQGDVWR